MQDVNKQLLDALKNVTSEIQGLMEESSGVVGFHLNGDVATWDELEHGGRFERLSSLPDAHEAMAAAEQAQQADHIVEATEMAQQAEPVGYVAPAELLALQKGERAAFLYPQPDRYATQPVYAQPPAVAVPGFRDLTDDELWEIRNHVAINEVTRDDDSKTMCVKHGRAIVRAMLAAQASTKE